MCIKGNAAVDEMRCSMNEGEGRYRKQQKASDVFRELKL
jgi:hypothetical protein